MASRIRPLRPALFLSIAAGALVSASIASLAQMPYCDSRARFQCFSANYAAQRFGGRVPPECAQILAQCNAADMARQRQQQAFASAAEQQHRIFLCQRKTPEYCQRLQLRAQMLCANADRRSMVDLGTCQGAAGLARECFATMNGC